MKWSGAEWRKDPQSRRALSPGKGSSAHKIYAYATDRFDDAHGPCHFPVSARSLTDWVVKDKYRNKCVRCINSRQKCYEVGPFGALWTSCLTDVVGALKLPGSLQHPRDTFRGVRDSRERSSVLCRGPRRYSEDFGGVRYRSGD